MNPLALWVVFASCVTAVCALVFIVTNINIYQLKECVMGAVQDAVDQVVAQLGKAKDEIVAEVAALEAQVAAGETPDLTALKAAAQALDDLNVDVPVEEPPAEPTV
jgi:hypothetical protein